MALTYEEQRLQNIKDNEALLLSLGLSTPTKPKPLKTPSKPSSLTPSKRKLEHHPETPSKLKSSTPRTPSRLNDDSVATPPSGLRRSGRSATKVDYSIERNMSLAELTPTKGLRGDELYDGDEDDGRLRNAKRLGMRIHDPKQFGHIPGVEVGRWWPSRMDASTDAIHAPTVAGISGNSIDGAYSVALSGGYPDDVDLGDRFTYTGSGGRDLKGTKTAPKNLRTAPQTMHQTFDNPMNASLKKSAETKRPVRVIRGFKLQSPYAPATGYRYDGLYVVERAWMGKGLTKGLMVCRYAFRRVGGQPELPIRLEGEGEVMAEEEEEEVDEEELGI